MPPTISGGHRLRKLATHGCRRPNFRALSAAASRAPLARRRHQAHRERRRNSTSADEADNAPPAAISLYDRVFGMASNTTTPDDTNRWKYVIPAFATHMCIGSPWAWSCMTGPLTKEIGFVSSAAADWSFADCTFPLSFVFLLQGVAAAAAAKWQLRVGGRASMGVAACCFGGGLTIGSVGIAMHSLPLLYFGYGILGGCGVGIAYTPPVQALIQWFPDKKGLASGLCIGGFGSGALLFAPAVGYLTRTFSTAPTFVGARDQIETVTREGVMYTTNASGAETEVVYANAMEISKLSAPWDQLQEGFFAVGTGSTGAAETLGVAGVGYFGIMMASAMTIKKPHPSYVPEGYTPPKVESGAVSGNVNVDNAMKTPQFWALFSIFGCVATGGMGLFSVAKPMVQEVFNSTLPAIATVGFAGSYLLALSACNLGGRLGWAAISDQIGRKATFNIFTLCSVPLYAGCPYLVASVVQNQSAMPMYLFCASSCMAITMMGGTYALLPAYEADLFGSKYVGAIHGRMLLASAGAALAGPKILLTLRKSSEDKAISDLLSKVDPEAFIAQFGAPISASDELINAKTLTIPKMLEIMPNAHDPTPFLYDSTMYTMAGVMGVAALAHATIRPVKSHFYEKE